MDDPKEDATRGDLSARLRKLSDDRQRAIKTISRLGAEIEALEQQAEAPFELRPSAPPSSRPATTPAAGRFVPAASGPRPTTLVPEDGLPEVGALRSHKGQRYLIIDTWEQLTEGERAAARLNAKLVGPEVA
jgi:hypothetical protein